MCCRESTAVADVTTTRARVADAVTTYLAVRLAELGRPASDLAAGMDLFESRILDSLALAALVAAVERGTDAEIDFLLIDPDDLATVEGIVDALTRAIGK